MLFLKNKKYLTTIRSFFISKTNPDTERDRKKTDGGIDKSPRWKVYNLHFIALIILIISLYIDRSFYWRNHSIQNTVNHHNMFNWYVFFNSKSSNR